MMTDGATAKAADTDFTFANNNMPEFRDLEFEKINQLDLDHPGANDAEYRQRRDYIASLAKKFRETGVITDVEYDEREQNVWRIVASRLEEIQARRASKI